MSKNLLNRLKNPSTIIGITSAGIIIAQNLGYTVPVENIKNIVNAVCTVGILLGIMNNPDTSGLL